MKQVVYVLSLAALCSFNFPESNSAKAPAQKTAEEDIIIEFFDNGGGCDAYGRAINTNAPKGTNICYFTIPDACKMRIILAEYVQSECGWMTDDVKQKIADRANGGQ